MRAFSEKIRAFRAIAVLAKKLEIASGVTTALSNWNDVIELKILLATAFDTLSSVTLPNK